jgi:hypothetical protein
MGVELGTAAVLWQAGAFDSETEQPERPFTFTGTDPPAAAIHF